MGRVGDGAGDMVHGLSAAVGEGEGARFSAGRREIDRMFTSARGKCPSGVATGVPSSLEAGDGQGCQAPWG